MSEEFDLSKKIEICFEEEDDIIDSIPVCDVKEFIKRLKEDIEILAYPLGSNVIDIRLRYREIMEIIDKLAGEKLSPNFKTKKQHNTDSNKSSKKT